MSTIPSSGNLDADAPLDVVALDSFVTLLSSARDADAAAFLASTVMDFVLDQLNDSQRMALATALLPAISVVVSAEEANR